MPATPQPLARPFIQRLNRIGWWTLLVGAILMLAGFVATFPVAASHAAYSPDWFRLLLGLAVLGLIAGVVLLFAANLYADLTATDLAQPRPIQRFARWYYAPPPARLPEPAPSQGPSSSSTVWVAIIILVVVFATCH